MSATYSAVIQQSGDWWIGWVEEVPGVNSQGLTREELLDNLRDALEEALRFGKPDIVNSDQGVQFTCNEFTGRLESEKIKISMDGRGRALDNVFTERLWRSVKYEEVYPKKYDTPPTAFQNLKAYFGFYNDVRIHQSLDYKTPAAVHYAAA